MLLNFLENYKPFLTFFIKSLIFKGNYRKADDDKSNLDDNDVQGNY